MMPGVRVDPEGVADAAVLVRAVVTRDFALANSLIEAFALTSPARAIAGLAALAANMLWSQQCGGLQADLDALQELAAGLNREVADGCWRAPK